MRIERVMLSESVDWRGIEIDQSGTPGNLIHTTLSDENVIDEIYLWAENTNDGGGGTLAKVTVEFGGVDTPADLIVRNIPLESGTQIVKGRPLSGDLLAVRVFSDLSAEVNVWGYVNRIFKE